MLRTIIQFSGIIFLLCVSCQQRVQPVRQAVSPNAQIAPGAVNLVYQGQGPVNNMQVAVIPVTGTFGSLLDYTGQVRLQGRMSVNGINCFGTQFLPFNCVAQANVGNLNANACQVGNITASMRIFLGRRTTVQNQYNIIGVTFTALPQNCSQAFINQGFPGGVPIVPGAVGIPPRGVGVPPVF